MTRRPDRLDREFLIWILLCLAIAWALAWAAAGPHRAAQRHAAEAARLREDVESLRWELDRIIYTDPETGVFIPPCHYDLED